MSDGDFRGISFRWDGISDGTAFWGWWPCSIDPFGSHIIQDVSGNTYTGVLRGQILHTNSAYAPGESDFTVGKDRGEWKPNRHYLRGETVWEGSPFIVCRCLIEHDPSTAANRPSIGSGFPYWHRLFPGEVYIRDPDPLGNHADKGNIYIPDFKSKLDGHRLGAGRKRFTIGVWFQLVSGWRNQEIPRHTIFSGKHPSQKSGMMGLVGGGRWFPGTGVEGIRIGMEVEETDPFTGEAWTDADKADGMIMYQGAIDRFDLGGGTWNGAIMYYLLNGSSVGSGIPNGHIDFWTWEQLLHVDDALGDFELGLREAYGAQDLEHPSNLFGEPLMPARYRWIVEREGDNLVTPKTQMKSYRIAVFPQDIGAFQLLVVTYDGDYLNLMDFYYDDLAHATFQVASVGASRECSGLEEDFRVGEADYNIALSGSVQSWHGAIDEVFCYDDDMSGRVAGKLFLETKRGPLDPWKIK